MYIAVSYFSPANCTKLDSFLRLEYKQSHRYSNLYELQLSKSNPNINTLCKDNYRHQCRTKVENLPHAGRLNVLVLYKIDRIVIYTIVSVNKV